jgi:hypothetical protein
MGKGGCAVAKEDIVSVLDKEREEKVQSQPKFYWAHDEEPHRRRWVKQRRFQSFGAICYFLVLSNMSYVVIITTESKRFWANTRRWRSTWASIHRPSTKLRSGLPSNSSRSTSCREHRGIHGFSVVTLYLDPSTTWWLLQCTSYHIISVRKG